MKLDKNKNYAVLTGDVIGSSSVPEESRLALLDRLEKTFEVVRNRYTDEIHFSLDIFSGDSWQFLLENPAKSLHAALLFRSYFKGCQPSLKVDTRVAIGVGKIASINSERISLSDGEAFRLSGRSLNTSFDRQNVFFSSSDANMEAIINAQLLLLDFLSTNWTEKQSLAVAGSLMGLSQKEIGNLWNEPIKQQSVADFLFSAGWKQCEKSLSLLEKWLENTGE